MVALIAQSNYKLSNLRKFFIIDEAIVQPKIKIPDFSIYGIGDFKEGYGRFAQNEHHDFWQILMKISF